MGRRELTHTLEETLGDFGAHEAESFLELFEECLFVRVIKLRQIVLEGTVGVDDLRKDTGVCNGPLDLSSVSNNALVTEQPVDILRSKRRHL